jgi:hypothetical protein
MTERLPEYLVRAVTDAQGASEYETAEDALRWLLCCAWDDLHRARESAANGRWSMACDSAVGKIVGLTGLVGPISWEQVQIDLLLDGTYGQVCAAMGVSAEFDRERVVDLRVRLDVGASDD